MAQLKKLKTAGKANEVLDPAHSLSHGYSKRNTRRNGGKSIGNIMLSGNGQRRIGPGMEQSASLSRVGPMRLVGNTNTSSAKANLLSN